MLTPTRHAAINPSVVVLDPADRRWILVRSRLSDRIAARVRGHALDTEIAAGAPVHASKLHAVRASMLVDPRRRDDLAHHWLDVITRSRRPPPVRDSRLPLARRQIPSAEGAITQLADALRSRRPVAARGVALAELLLTDGLGPVYSVRARRPLDAMLYEVIWHLDPLRGFIPDPPPGSRPI